MKMKGILFLVVFGSCLVSARAEPPEESKMQADQAFEAMAAPRAASNACGGPRGRIDMQGAIADLKKLGNKGRSVGRAVVQNPFVRGTGRGVVKVAQGAGNAVRGTFWLLTRPYTLIGLGAFGLFFAATMAHGLIVPIATFAGLALLLVMLAKM